MPLLIPESMINKEKEHIEGFAPELFLVTHKGDKKLTENYAIRPTSEVLFADYFSQVIKNAKDLPLKINQWANVMRAEKNTKPFIRGSEFH
jgi:prolyl-tRNA synthetase